MKAKTISGHGSSWDREMLNTIMAGIARSGAQPNLEIVLCFADLVTALLHLDKLGLLPNPIGSERAMLEQNLATARSLLESAAAGRKNWTVQ